MNDDKNGKKNQDERDASIASLNKRRHMHSLAKLDNFERMIIYIEVHAFTLELKAEIGIYYLT